MHCPLCCAVESVGRTDSRERLMTVSRIPFSLRPWPLSDGAALMRAILVTDDEYSPGLQHSLMNWCLGRNSVNSVLILSESRRYRLICRVAFACRLCKRMNAQGREFCLTGVRVSVYLDSRFKIVGNQSDCCRTTSNCIQETRRLYNVYVGSTVKVVD